MYLMIDRSSYGISLIKVFGYRGSEIRKLYLNGNFHMGVIGEAIIGLYFMINQLLVLRLNKIVPSEFLKNRE